MSACSPFVAWPTIRLIPLSTGNTTSPNEERPLQYRVRCAHPNIVTRQFLPVTQQSSQEVLRLQAMASTTSVLVCLFKLCTFHAARHFDSTVPARAYTWEGSVLRRAM
eukprot:1159027-Pelagomonas_calceolata.AAC.3